MGQTFIAFKKRRIMRVKSLLVIAVAVSVVGLFVLAMIRPEVSPQLLQIEGVVERIDARGGVSFVRFQPSNFTVVSFNAEHIEEGNQVLIGRLQSYEGRVQFVVESTREIPVER